MSELERILVRYEAISEAGLTAALASVVNASGSTYRRIGAHMLITDDGEVVRGAGLEVLRSPIAAPKANSICERVIGTIRRECLDWMIPMSEPHLRTILKEWVTHYNRGRPHSALGPGVPDPPHPTIRHSDTAQSLHAPISTIRTPTFWRWWRR